MIYLNRAGRAAGRAVSASEGIVRCGGGTSLDIKSKNMGRQRRSEVMHQPLGKAVRNLELCPLHPARRQPTAPQSDRDDKAATI